MAVRKSRLRRLGSSTGIAWPDFPQLEKEGWARIEKHCRPLTEEERGEIVGITKSYLTQAVFEQNAPFERDAVAFIDRLRKAAGAFADLFHAHRPSEKGTAMREAESAIEESFHSDRLPNGGSMTGLVMILHAFMAACESASNRLRGDRYAYVDGQAWKQWIVSLGDFWEIRGGRATARKDSDKRSSNDPSPFVAFVWELQQTLPEDLRRHDHSMGALSLAISDALKKAPLTNREVKSRRRKR